MEDELKTYLDARHPKELGTIESIELVREKDAEGKKTEKLKGYGFINVSSEDMADKMAIQHATFEFGGRNVEIKKSDAEDASLFDFGSPDQTKSIQKSSTEIMIS